LKQSLEHRRRVYAEEVCSRSGVGTAALVRAFATVPRERFLGPGPWQILVSPPAQYRLTDDADPRHLYRDVLVAIDPSRLLNNGQPSAHAAWMAQLDLQAGEHVVHVGCGTGYYAAIFAEVVGPAGRITAIELDPELSERARINLAPYLQVQVIAANGCTHAPDAADAVYVNAGATHPQAAWLDCLKVGGRLLLPLVRWPARQEETALAGCGVVVKITRTANGHAARIVSLVGIFPCLGAVDPEADQHLAEALASGADVNAVRSLRRDAHQREPDCWLHSIGFCLSARPSR